MFTCASLCSRIYVRNLATIKTDLLMQCGFQLRQEGGAGAGPFAAQAPGIWPTPRGAHRHRGESQYAFPHSY